ncbi:MAG TPA: plastocyanin/azurin family copper-binding protein [Acidimicrobiia bacterium]|nr:plastocyanin/azurin family copper-binding protein [Acidimicrobiia bacterium]
MSSPLRSGRGLFAGAVLLAVAVTGVAATAGASGPAPTPPTKTIKLGDNFFKPSNVTVVSGTVVTFQWTGSNTHNVTVIKGPQKFTSPNQSDGTYQHVFAKPGTYKIQCTFHPGMNLTVKVKKAPSTTTTSTSTPPPSS